MKRELSMDFKNAEPLVREREEEKTEQQGTVSRAPQRDPNPTMQMSVRMKPEIYEQFQKHARLDRRTNGEMLELMMRAYERELKRSD